MFVVYGPNPINWRSIGFTNESGVDTCQVFVQFEPMHTPRIMWQVDDR